MINNEKIILKYKDILKNNNNFQELILNSGDYLIKEGKKDQNIYFIIDGKLSIEKYTTSEKNETKQLATIESGDFLGEAAFKRNDPKEVSIKALKKTILLKIDAKKGFLEFVKQEPKIGLEILVDIIDISNKRLLESNNRLTSILKMSEEIANLENYNNENIFKLIDSFKKIINSDYIIYLERNPILENYVTIKYDSRSPGKMKDIIIDLGNKQLLIDDLKNNNIEINKYNIIKQLRNGNKTIGYLVFGRKNKNFSELDIKNITPIANALAGAIKQKEYFEEQKNKEYLKNS